jgi:large-conductance mechanosensitive channel
MMNVKKEEPVVVLTKQEELLIEIRDLLKAKAS